MDNPFHPYYWEEKLLQKKNMMEAFQECIEDIKRGN
jgi:hypothetical protein